MLRKFVHFDSIDFNRVKYANLPYFLILVEIKDAVVFFRIISEDLPSGDAFAPEHLPFVSCFFLKLSFFMGLLLPQILNLHFQRVSKLQLLSPSVLLKSVLAKRVIRCDSIVIMKFDQLIFLLKLYRVVKRKLIYHQIFVYRTCHLGG